MIKLSNIESEWKKSVAHKKACILLNHPVHNNIQFINRLESFMRDILSEKDKDLIESILEKVYFKRIGNVWLECESI